MTFRQKLSSLAAAALLVPSIAAAREQASKYHYDGIYKGTIPIGLLTNESDNRRARPSSSSTRIDAYSYCQSSLLRLGIQ
jgi:hypothetical protein